MASRRAVRLLACLAMVFAISTAVPATAEAAFPGGNGKIVFASAAAGSFDSSIWVMDANGTGRTQLTDFGPGSDHRPRWSADGTKIAFSRRPDADGLDHVWIMDADGSNETELGLGRTPAWSPDGTRIAFGVVADPVFDFDVWTMDADGSDRTQLTHHLDAVAPGWSPDGSRIAYGRSALGGFNGFLQTIEPDGTDDKQLRVTVAVPSPDWSPDGRRIAFHESSGGAFEVFTIAAAGGPVVNVTGSHAELPPWLASPAFSPDGRKLVLSGGNTASSQRDVFVINADGTGLGANITQTPAISEVAPDWQPSPPYPFGDIATSTFVNDIVWLRAEGLTAGCTAFLYCPTAEVTRGQIASFLARALSLPPTAPDYFVDDETSSHEAAINAIRHAGITSGCGPDRYCPNATLTRAQLATLFARAFDLPASGIDHFTDDDASAHEADIDRLAAADIARGCTATTFCPAASVSRGQVAAFLHRALD